MSLKTRFMIGNRFQKLLRPFLIIGVTRNSAGVTLLELIVAVAIFTVVVSGSSGVFISALRAQRVVLAEQNLIDNIRFALEFMSRELRLASRDDTGTCTGTAYMTYTNSSGVLKFINSDGECVHYRLQGSAIQVSQNGGLSFSNLTFSSVALVTNLSFIISGESRGDHQQPRATILITAESTGGLSEVTPKINIQTSVSARSVDS